MAGMGHNQPAFVSVDALSDADKKRLKEAMGQMNDSMTRVAAERDHQKAILNDLQEKLGVNKKIARRMAKVYFKSNFQEEQDDNNQFEEFYKEVLG